MKHKNLGVGAFVLVASALLALCAPSYVRGAPEQWLKVRNNQCTWQVGYVRPVGAPNPTMVLTVQDVAPGDGKTCWVQLTRPNGNPEPVLGCYAEPVLKVKRKCVWEWRGWGVQKPKQYRVANATDAQNVRGVQWKWVP